MGFLKTRLQKVLLLFAKEKKSNNQFRTLMSKEKFLLDLLNYSYNDIDVFCTHLGQIYTYYIMTGDQSIDYSVEELLSKYVDGDNYKERAIDKGVFTHSCNGSMIDLIKQNGLGSSLNQNEELFAALNFLEEKLGTTGDYTKQQSGRLDEVYFTAPGASTFGYACHFAPERLFLGVLKQDRDKSLPVAVGENKIDYYRRVLFSKFDNLDTATKRNIEIVLNGYFSKPNYVVSFPVSSVIDGKDIYLEIVGDAFRINLREYIDQNCESFDYRNFFTTQVGSNSNTNNLDNLVMINNVIPQSQLDCIAVPDYYDLIQMIARNKGFKFGEKLDYFTAEAVKEEKKEERPVLPLSPAFHQTTIQYPTFDEDQLEPDEKKGKRR